MRNLILALALIGTLSGCAAVVVGGAAAVGAAHDRRSFGTVLDDSNIELTAYDLLNRDKDLITQSRVTLIVHNGVALLIGETPNDALKVRAGNTVNQVKGVRRVVNELAVEPRASFGRGTRDAALTTQVKTSLLNINDMANFDPTRVNVSTARGIVYLMGLVTREEADRVADTASRVRGVESVVKVFEYLR
jgi:osmotically-inducible protein OsmY